MSDGDTRIESSVHADTVNIIPLEDGKNETSSGRPQTEGMTSAGLSRGEILLAFVFVGCLSLVAVILAAVAIGRSSNVSLSDNPGDSGDDYVWTFAAGHSAHALEYIDGSTGQLRGFSIDLIDAVCKEANKNCEFIWDLYKNCWDSEPGVPAHGGVGLLGRWYDGCSAWIQTRDRLNTFKFSKPFVRDRRSPVALYTAPTNDVFDWKDMSGRTVGFLDGWVIDESCLMLYDEIQGFNKSNVRHFATVEDFSAAIRRNEVDCGFMFFQEPFRSQLTVLTPGGLETKCWVESNSVMTRKDSRLTLWWNDAFDKIRANGKYHEVCKDLTEVHGYTPEPKGPHSVCLDD